MNDADIWFEHSEYTIHSELANIRDIARQVSRSYRPAQVSMLLNIRDDINKLIESWNNAS